MIKETKIKISLNSRNWKRFQELGYEIPKNSECRVKMVHGFKRGTLLEIDVEHVNPGSKAKVTRVCDDCLEEKLLPYREAIKAPLCKSCRAKGSLNHFHGKKHTKETCQKISDNHGQKLSKEQEANLIKIIEEKQCSPSSDLISELSGISKQTICTVLNRLNRRDLFQFNTSGREREIVDFIQSVYSGEIIKNSRSLIAPYEIDIYLPELKIAFEYNGLYWHSENKGKDRNYHKTKFQECKNKGVALYTIWEHQWGDSWKSMIRKLLTPKQRIFARKTVITTNKTQIQEFISKHHLQKSAPSKYYVGLLYNNKIVAAATLGFHHRGTGEMVLNRVCFSDYSVIGGLEKMLKVVDYKGKIVTWSDNCYAPSPTLYENSGFIKEAELSPDYFYTSGDGKYFSKQSQRKSAISCPPHLTEVEWAEERGLYRVWDCGKIKWYKILT